MSLPIVNSMIHLMKDNEVAHTITINNIDDYEFEFDSEELSKMSITTSSIRMRDLDILVNKPYEHYVVMGTKIVDDKPFSIPSKVFCHIKIINTKGKTIICFSDEKGQ